MACDNFYQDFEFGDWTSRTDSDGLSQFAVEWNADTFGMDYNETVNKSIEYGLDEKMYDARTKDCCSPLYERPVEQLTTLDDLDIGDQSDNTYIWWIMIFYSKIKHCMPLNANMVTT